MDFGNINKITTFIISREFPAMCYLPRTSNHKDVTGGLTHFSSLQCKRMESIK